MSPEQLAALCKAFALGAPMDAPTRVYGGLLHKMWKINTPKGRYAIKALSSDIPLQDERVRRQYVLTERVAACFSKRGIPAITALEIAGGPVFEHNGSYFLVYPWVDAHALDTKTISEEHALKMAKILAEIHQINLDMPGLQVFTNKPYTAERMLSLIQKAEAHHCPFAADLRVHESALLQAQAAYLQSTIMLQKGKILTHADLDQKNVLWDQYNQPIVIDWEAATLVNPVYDLMNTSLYWSGILSDQFNSALLIKMLQTYQEAGGQIDTSLLQAAFDGVYAWIEWIDYNVERACMSNDFEARNMGIEQVQLSLTTLLRLQKKMPNLVDAVGFALL